MKTRNPNGTGTIIKRADGRYEWRQMIDGQVRYIYARSPSELERKRREVLGLPIHKDIISVGQWFDKWLEAYVKPLKAEATYKQYSILYNVHIKPVIANCKMISVKNHDIMKIITDMHKLKKSEATMKHVRKILHIAFALAVKDKIISANPAEGIDIPTRQAPTRKVLTADEVARFLAVMDKSRWIHSVKFALVTGVRRGELLALKWSDIDDEKITIRQSVTRYGQGDTKSRKERYVPLTENAKAILTDQKKMLHDEINPSIIRNMPPLVFPSQTGSHVTPQVYLNTLKRYGLKAGITVTVHSLRHTYVYFTRNILSIKELQNSLGHERSTTTLDLYGDMLGDFKDTARKIDQIFVGIIDNKHAKSDGNMTTNIEKNKV